MKSEMSKVSGIGQGILRGSFSITKKQGRAASGDFSQMLREACEKKLIKLSVHAEERIAQRGITVGADDIEKLSVAMESVAEKGGSKAAILYHNTVFIADVGDRAIITALDKDNVSEMVFTGIDSAVVI